MYTKTGNLRLVQKINRSLVLNLIREKGPLSRADISKITKLTRSTVSSIVEYLIRKDLIKEIGLTSSGVGRKAILLELNSKAYYSIGVDLGTLHTTITIIDLLGRIEKRIEYPTNCQLEKDKILEKLKANIYNIIKNSGIKREKIAGIGIAAPGLIDKKGTMLITPNFGWRDTPLREILKKKFHIPVFVDNNVNVMALAESEFGEGQGVKNFVFINVGMGIGSGVVINGELFHGESNCTGEIGHTTVDYNGPKCSCGNNGCLEVMASGPAIAKRAIKAIKEGEKSLISKLVNYDFNQISAEIVATAANQGDKLGQSIMEETGEYLGTGVANIINLFNPKLVIIGGGVTQAGDLIFKPLKRIAQKRAFSVSAEVAKIIPVSLGKDCTVIGAAALVLKEIFKITRVITSSHLDSIK
ncbi:ROK family transcriptional regulator [bacterium]|nr:ROK family transcriptional regulator [bacterium]